MLDSLDLETATMPSTSKALQTPYILDEILSYFTLCGHSEMPANLLRRSNLRGARNLSSFLQVSASWAEVAIPRLWSNYATLKSLVLLMYPADVSFLTRLN